MLTAGVSAGSVMPRPTAVESPSMTMLIGSPETMSPGNGP